jgi:hypothetical protein
LGNAQGTVELSHDDSRCHIQHIMANGYLRAFDRRLPLFALKIEAM